MKIQIAVLCVLACALFSCPASADFTLKLFKEVRASSNPDLNKSLDNYVIGVGRGIFWANAMLGVRGDKRLYCPPDNLSMDGGLVLSLLDQEIRSPVSGIAYKDDNEIEMILLRSLQLRFPCQ